jgi:hypothetical protein
MTHFKVIDASQTLIHQFENLNWKLYKCNACIYFNRQCLAKKVTPSYAKIKIPNTSPAHKHTQQIVTTMRIKDEIKFLSARNKN